MTADNGDVFSIDYTGGAGGNDIVLTLTARARSRAEHMDGRCACDRWARFHAAPQTAEGANSPIYVPMNANVIGLLHAKSSNQSAGANRWPVRGAELILWTDCSNHRFEFHKSGQLLIRVHNKTLSVVALCVCNPDRSPLGINR